MSKVYLESGTLVDIADAIRAKTGSQETMKPSQMGEAISDIAGISDYVIQGKSYGNNGTVPMGYWVQHIDKLPRLQNDGGWINANYFYGFLGTNLDEATSVRISGTYYCNGMFMYCSNIESINLSSWFITGGRSDGMFTGCTKLKKIDVRNFQFSKMSNYSGTFGDSARNGPADNCLIIVKDQTEKDWINTKFPRLTNVQTVEEYEASQNNS